MKFVLTALSALALSACGTHTYTLSSHDGGWERSPSVPVPTVVTAPFVNVPTTPSPVVPKPVVTPTPAPAPKPVPTPAPKPTKGGCK